MQPVKPAAARSMPPSMKAFVSERGRAGAARVAADPAAAGDRAAGVFTPNEETVFRRTAGRHVLGIAVTGIAVGGRVADREVLAGVVAGGAGRLAVARPRVELVAAEGAAVREVGREQQVALRAVAAHRAGCAAGSES